MENLHDTESILKKFKDELLIAVKITISEENRKRDEKLDMITRQLIEGYNSSSDNVRSAIIQVGSRMENLNSKTVSVPNVIANQEIADSNMVKLLSTFEKAMCDAARVLAKNNEETLGKYTGMIYDQFSGIAGKMNDKFAQSFDNGMDKLSYNINGFIENLVEKNKVSLQDVQSENNLELQKLSDSLYRLTNENEKLKEYTQNTLGTLSDNMNGLISVSEKFDSTLHSYIDAGVSGMENVMERQISRMIEKNVMHEKNNADEFRKSMEDYREKFIKANAEAIAQVQSDMLRRMEETQRQLALLSETMKNCMDFIKNHEEKSVMLNNELRETVTTHSKEMLDKTKNSMDNFDCSIGEIKTLIEDDISDMINKNSEMINDTVSGALDRYNKEFRELRTKISDALGTIEALSEQITVNSNNYQATLKQVTDSQRQSQELSKKDVELLERMLSKI